jgi:methyl-accepting chemotaxis protein
MQAALNGEAGAGLPESAASDGRLDAIAAAATGLGHDIVDVTGFLDSVLASAKDQGARLDTVSEASASLSSAGVSMIGLSDRLSGDFESLSGTLERAAGQLRTAMGSSQDVIAWVAAFASRLAEIDLAMAAARKSNQEILRIAREVNILAINARIEAVRAGAAGSGFGIIAEAVTNLSGQTEGAARDVTDRIQSLGVMLRDLQAEAALTSEQAETSLAQTREAESALGVVSQSGAIIGTHLTEMRDSAGRMRQEVDAFGPVFDALGASVRHQTGTIDEARDRVGKLISQSEGLMQSAYALGGRTDDATQITDVQMRARALSEALEAAVARGEISREALFDTQYKPIAGTNPPQVMAAFTPLTDRLFAPVQEEAISANPGAVFCAAVDRNGYLPTHNRRFSQPQGKDPVWNMANCRNRRIFDDRVGLAAGRSTAPFLMQVYRRDMGGGKFAMMKDVSAPIVVNGRHWGGLRLAYAF